MDSPNSAKEFEITGVSRSGRVRKKSSKLLDFRSPDDIEPKFKKNQRSGKGQFKLSPDTTVKSRYDMDDKSDEELHTGNENDNSDTEDDADDMFIDDHSDGTDDSGDQMMHQNLYVADKSNKRKIVTEKTQRKMKGKAKPTAYMLWAREIKNNVLKKDSNSDFLNNSRKLGEMWTNVSASEKSMWRARAKALVNKTKPTQNEEVHEKQNKTSAISRIVSSRSKKHTQQPSVTSDSIGLVENEPITSSIFCSTKIGSNNFTQPGAFKVTGLEPMDIAAHLKLLGDSLTIIGERLKEHEGQITVSGSLSVLLDSLLCSIGPLVCLCTRIPGLETKKVLNDSLHTILDNIAYIMPGL